MMTAVILLALTMALAWANCANDVSKGIAALAGSGVATLVCTEDSNPKDGRDEP
jgi:phosphate/sulfate permease